MQRRFWATGSLEWPEFGDTVIKYYVDGETTASVTATINQLTGMFYNHLTRMWHP